MTIAAAKYEITGEILKKLRPAITEALPEVGLLVNAPEDGENDEFDESTDDEIAFRLPDGSRLDHAIQSGPYGAFLNKYSGEGADFGVETVGSFSYSTIDKLISEVIERLRATDLTASPGP